MSALPEIKWVWRVGSHDALAPYYFVGRQHGADMADEYRCNSQAAAQILCALLNELTDRQFVDALGKIAVQPEWIAPWQKDEAA